MNYPFDSSRETLGLMVCHAVCGAVGALPPTGVFVRTSLNVPLADWETIEMEHGLQRQVRSLGKTKKLIDANLYMTCTSKSSN